MERTRKVRSDREKLSDLKLGKVEVERDGKTITVCNVATVAEFLNKTTAEIKNWLTGIDNKKTKKHTAGLFDKYGGKRGVCLLLGCDEIDMSGGRGKTDTSLIAELEELLAQAELAEQLESADETETASA